MKLVDIFLQRIIQRLQLINLPLQTVVLLMQLSILCHNHILLNDDLLPQLRQLLTLPTLVLPLDFLLLLSLLLLEFSLSLLLTLLQLVVLLLDYFFELVNFTAKALKFTLQF
jgi:hypothetical protein